ncbi:VWA domain-containing protein [Pendulispora albinea]|uniref:VWA domain-containing protein n=1 Tax=Pendulispora albinea TaxID=2741071 RepID=A0ABZ2LVG4_9BACT
MPDLRAITRVLDELLWSLRRAGFVISTAQAIDCARAAAAVGLGSRDTLCDALAAVIVTRADSRLRFDRAFDAFFLSAHGPRGPRGDIWQRLGAAGFTEDELAELRTLLTALAASSRERGGHEHPLAALVEGGAELDRLLQLTSVRRSLDALHNPLQAGFFAYRVEEKLGLPRARSALGALRTRLRDAFGARGDLLADALKAELDRASDEVRSHVRDVVAQRTEETSRASTLSTTPFVRLSQIEIDEVRRAVRRFAERLRGGERLKRRRARQGRIDPHLTLRRALRTGGVPFEPVRRVRRRDKPRLVLLCDVSDSVRAAACFMLEFVAATHDLFDRTRSFVFVSDLAETTQLFERESIDVALARAYGGQVVAITSNSNYGRALRLFESRHLNGVDRRTTVVILGDGRTNFHDDAAEVLGRIRSRARALVWLSPESRGNWAIGDSAMARYEPQCTQVLEVRSARELEDAARLLVHLR